LTKYFFGSELESVVHHLDSVEIEMLCMTMDIISTM